MTTFRSEAPMTDTRTRPARRLEDAFAAAKRSMTAAAEACLRGDPDAVQKATQALERLRAAEESVAPAAAPSS